MASLSCLNLTPNFLIWSVKYPKILSLRGIFRSVKEQVSYQISRNEQGITETQ